MFLSGVRLTRKAKFAQEGCPGPHVGSALPRLLVALGVQAQRYCGRVAFAAREVLRCRARNARLGEARRQGQHQGSVEQGERFPDVAVPAVVHPSSDSRLGFELEQQADAAPFAEAYTAGTLQLAWLVPLHWNQYLSEQRAARRAQAHRRRPYQAEH